MQRKVQNRNGWMRAALLAAALSAVPALSACSIPLGDIPSPWQLPASAPARPAEPGVFPAVHDVPQRAPDDRLTDDERRRLEAELLAARDAQARRAAAAQK